MVYTVQPIGATSISFLIGFSPVLWRQVKAPSLRTHRGRCSRPLHLPRCVYAEPGLPASARYSAVNPDAELFERLREDLFMIYVRNTILRYGSPVSPHPYGSIFGRSRVHLISRVPPVLGSPRQVSLRSLGKKRSCSVPPTSMPLITVPATLIPWPHAASTISEFY